MGHRNDTFGVNAIKLDMDCPLHHMDIESFDPPNHDESVPRALIDTGAFASCTDQKHLLHNYRPFTADFPCPLQLQPAVEGSDTVPLGVGYLHVPCPIPGGYIAVRTYYHPNLRTTVIDERAIRVAAGLQKADYPSYNLHTNDEAGVWSFTLYHRLRHSQNFRLHGVLIQGKCYTHELIAPILSGDDPSATIDNSLDVALAENSDFRREVAKATVFNIFAWQHAEYTTLCEELDQLPFDTSDFPIEDFVKRNAPICAIKQATERLLWHQRLGHPSDYYLTNAHKHIKGVPKFSHMVPILENCPTCLRAKLAKQPAGPHTTRTATAPFQGLSIDFSFSGTRSKNPDHDDDFLGLNGESCWILISDHFTRYLVGDTRVNKGSPLNWLRHFLEKHSPDCADKYVVLDQGGELYHNPAVIKLFRHFKYEIRPTGADASNQNGPVERAHRTIADAVRSFLYGANLPVRFWPYAFHHYIRIKNSMPSRDQEESPLKMAFGKTDDFTHFRTFGCRVYVRPPGQRPGKFRTNPRKGIFLGFLPHTTQNILWYDEETHRVKIAKHVRFDEGMNDLPHAEIPPNVIHLQRTQDGEPFPAEKFDATLPDLDFSPSPFKHLRSYNVEIRCDHPTYGLSLATDTLLQRVYVHNLIPQTSASHLHSSHKASCNKIRGAYITSINDVPVFTLDDARMQFAILRERQVFSFPITFATEKRLTARQYQAALHEHDIFMPHDPDFDEPHAPTLTVNLLRIVDRVLADGLEICDRERLIDTRRLPIHQIRCALLAIASIALTPEEKALGHFTRRKLKPLSTWPIWLAGEWQQLDQFHAINMFGKPCKPPPNAIILRSHWRYGVKQDGTRRPRHCCDGSKKSAPLLHRLAKTYSNCVNQPIQRLFMALAAALCYLIFGGDARDAYAHSPGSLIKTFLTIDDQYVEWYFERFGITLDKSLVLPINNAMQGNPEASRLWENHANSILTDLGFTSTTHDRAIYSATIDGVTILLLRQVDDFLIASPTEAIAKTIFDKIGARLQHASEATTPFKYFGLAREFNGVEIGQYRDSIVISATKYIDRVIHTHGWSQPNHESTPVHRTPIPDDAISSMFHHTGPAEDTPEHAALTTRHGFKYRSLLGELLYTYVTCRPDVGYALVTLSKFASAPHDVHFSLLKSVALYLRETKHWGIVYHRNGVLPVLSPNPMAFLPNDPKLPAFPQPSTPISLLCLVDAAHGNDLRARRSTTGYVFMLSGGAISYRCTTQSVTATSSTEAEFLAAVTAAKQARYLRFILHELGFPQLSPTPIYEDNISAINMVNSRVPTERSRHIDIQYFAIQDWKDNGDIEMRHASGIINSADDMTKPLGWVLHHRHCRRTMGHYIFIHPPSSSSLSIDSTLDSSIGGGYWPKATTQVNPVLDVQPVTESSGFILPSKTEQKFL